MGVLAGCGGEYASVTEGDAVSGPAVSGEAVSGNAIQEKTVSGPAVKKQGDMSSHCFCTDTNLYYTENGSIMQMRLDGTNKVCVIKAGKYKSVWVCYADVDWLYYVSYDKFENEETLCRVPIRKDADGYDVVRMSEKEEIVDGYEGVDLKYVDSEHLFYTMEETVGKYNICGHRIISETDMRDYACSFGIFRVGGYYVVATDNGEIFVQPVDEEEWTRASDFIPFEGYDICDFVVQDNEAVYYPQYATEDKKYIDYRHNQEYTFPRTDYSYDITRYDGEKETDFVTWEQLKEVVLEAGNIEEFDACRPDYMFFQNGRLYIQVQIDWEREGIYHREYMILSQGTKEDSGLRYERNLTECMKSHVKSRTGKWAHIFQDSEKVIKEHMVINNARCIAMVNQKAYLSLYDYEKDKGHMGCFELDSGKFQWVDKEDALFYELGYDYVLSDMKEVYKQKKEDDLEYRENEIFGWEGPGEGGEFFEN